jgi:DNA polymerase-3 subunit beta
MEIKVGRSQLLSALQRCQGIIPTRGTMPILSYVLLQADKEGIYLSATDLDVTIRGFTPAEVAETGEITLLARKVFEIVRELPEAPVHITSQENNYIKLVCGAASFVLVGLPAEDFPALPRYKEQDFFPLDKQVLAEMIRKTLFAIPSVETRFSMTGALLELEGQKVSMVGTDGHRLAYITQTLKTEASQSASLILPKKVLSELKKLIDEAQGSVAASLQEKHAIFTSEEVVLMGRLIEGSFPNYRQVIPDKSTNQVVIDKESLTHALRRVAVLSDEKSHSVRFQLEKDTLELSSQDSEFGDAHEEINIKYSGQSMTLGFNASYVLDALSVMDEEQVRLEFSEPLSPCLFRPEGNDDYLCVIMPMKVD